MHNFVLHSNESACGKSGRLGLDQVLVRVTGINGYGIVCGGVTGEIILGGFVCGHGASGVDSVGIRYDSR